MADAYDSSPYEQGELAPSPDRRHVQVNSEEERDELSLSPHGGDTFDDPEDITDDDKRMEEDGDDSESLDIKPPQMQAGRREKSHKHKHKEDKRREREKRHRDFADDKERFGHHRGSGREKHTLKDAREHIREKQREKERKRKEDEEREARKREESIRERERLERLERERQRERRMRDDRDHKSQEKKRWEDDRRMGSGKERRRHRRDDRIRSRSRERHHRQGGQLGSEKSFEHDQRKVEEKATWRGPHTPEEEYLGAEGEDYRDHYQEEVHGGEEGEHSEQELMEEPDLQLEPQHQDSTPPSKSPSDSSSSSPRRSRQSRSSFGSPPLEPGSPHSSEDHTNNLKHKLKSKFDDHSASEDEDDDDDDDDEFLPVEEEDGDKIYVEDSPVPSPEPSKLPNYYPAYMGCRSVEEFSCLNRIEEGTYGVVYRARDKNSSQIVALKRLKMEKEKEGFPVTSLREINTLLKAQHPNIVTVREIVVGSNMDKIYIVMDYVAHDLKSLMETMKQPFSIGETKSLMQQLLRAVAHLHDNWILHRDLKTSNLLLSHNGILKVGDFGLAREYGSPLKNYTPVVVTLWYRAPELLLNCKQYTTHIDMWSVGCIFAELLTLKPLWPGKSEVDQINRIFKDLGTPNETIWPGVSELPGMKKINFTKYTYNVLRQRFGPYLTELGFSLLNKFLTYCPEKRGTAEECLKDEFFEEAPLPTDPNMFPTWPAKSEQQPRKHASSPRPPSGGKAYAKLLGDDDDAVAGFHMGNAHKGASAQGHGFQLKF